MIPVIVESPFAGKGDARIVDAAYKRAYLAACLHDCYMRGESPVASHAIGPLALDDDDPKDRELGITAIKPWRRLAAKTVVYEDLGVLGGMKWGVKDADDTPNHEVEFRKLGFPWTIGAEGLEVFKVAERWLKRCYEGEELERALMELRLGLEKSRGAEPVE